jgi:hypothetical protein
MAQDNKKPNGLTKKQLQDILDNFGEYEEDSRNKTKEVIEDNEERVQTIKEAPKNGNPAEIQEKIRKKK